MSTRSSSNLLYVCGLSLLFLTGCTGKQPTAPMLQEGDGSIYTRPNPGGNTATRLGLRFTGRDSFGVALAANASLAPNDAGGLEGTGTATHMGRMQVEQSHEISCDEIGGQFTWFGATGSELTGTYAGSVEPATGGDGYTVGAQVEITRGDVRFSEADAFGRGTLTGTLDADGRFDYTVDGWLLHHVREESNSGGAIR